MHKTKQLQRIALCGGTPLRRKISCQQSPSVSELRKDQNVSTIKHSFVVNKRGRSMSSQEICACHWTQLISDDSAESADLMNSLTTWIEEGDERDGLSMAVAWGSRRGQQKTLVVIKVSTIGHSCTSTWHQPTNQPPAHHSGNLRHSVHQYLAPAYLSTPATIQHPRLTAPSL